MKTSIKLICLAAVLAVTSCRKNDDNPAPSNPVTVYTVLSKYAVPMQTYTINGITGGSFTSPQGTVVNIPANAFVTLSGIPVTGNVTIQFRDIYKKSDMLLADRSTTTIWAELLKSGGEFFIKAKSNNFILQLAEGKKITVSQPASLTGGVDSTNAMLPFALPMDSTGEGFVWLRNYEDSIRLVAGNYIYSFYQFKSPVDSGSWCNSDNTSFFDGYKKRVLFLMPTDDIKSYHTDVFLIFKSITAMVHVGESGGRFYFYGAPIGLECTIVAIGIKDGNLYSSFTPITISDIETYNFTLSPTTVSAFIAQINELN